MIAMLFYGFREGDPLVARRAIALITTGSIEQHG